MSAARVYVPSRALLRALSQPRPLRCPIVRSFAHQSARASRNSRSKTDHGTNHNARKQEPSLSPEEQKKVAEELEATIAKVRRSGGTDRPYTDAEIESGALPTVNHYEHDLDKGSAPRLISRIQTAEEWKKEKKMFEMMEEAETNPRYDPTELNRRMIDRLLSDPSLSHMKGDLMEIKRELKGQNMLQEIEDAKKEAAEDQRRDKSELYAKLRMAMDQELQDLIDDPDIGEAKEDVQALRDMMPESDDLTNPAFAEAREKTMAKLAGNKAFEKRVAAAFVEESDQASLEKSIEDYYSKVNRAITAAENGQFGDLDPAAMEEGSGNDLHEMITQMRDIMRAIGGDKTLETEMDRLLSQDPHDLGDDPNEKTFDREMDAEELANELKNLTISQRGSDVVVEEDEEVLPQELKAKVDKIMADPKLVERLIYLQKLIKEAGMDSDDITTIAHEVAPDPEKLESSRTATLRERMQAAREDPEHIAALDALQVQLPEPFNISPALKSFNQAIEMAYIGANDDIRRVLWRTYTKARKLPTFLQSLGDDAWDILYYSQAVTWSSNQNRQAHLKLLLADLKSVGKDGPPTHPSSLAE